MSEPEEPPPDINYPEPEPPDPDETYIVRRERYTNEDGIFVYEDTRYTHDQYMIKAAREGW